MKRKTDSYECTLDLDNSYKEDDKWLDEQRSKMGGYDNPPDGCPSCKRHRIMKGVDEKHRCEKCAWCIEDNNYDYDFFSYIR